MQMTKRVRDITDFIAYPIISVDGTYSRIEIFRGSRPSLGSRINPSRYFNVEPVIAMYNTYQEIQPVKEETSEFVEKFNDIRDNPAWIRYLKEEKNIKSDAKIKEVSNAVQSTINPWGYRSEAERKVDEDYTI